MSETTTKAETNNLIEELKWRGLIKDCTDEQGLAAHFNSAPRKVYCGFDPTADSLTIGNLVPIMMLAHVKRAGHTPIVVMGGGTGLIGDPSGKSAERMMMTAETVQHHVDCQRPIFENVLGPVARLAEPGEQSTDPARRAGPPIILNNLDWLAGISYIEALRDIGKHFSVNMMMQKESVKERLNNREQGISYTEFSYMILQAYDFAYLYEKEGITVQFGGSDQYGNIVAGADLIRRKLAAESHVPPARSPLGPTESDRAQSAAAERKLSDAGADLLNAEVSEDDAEKKRLRDRSKQSYRDAEAMAYDRHSLTFGLTAPLLQKADGGKFGKTESGAIWLTANRTSPYAYYQFWLNASDEDARNWIKIFTFLPQDEIQSLIDRHDQSPGQRELQRTLAQHATTILHGEPAMLNAEAAGKALFSGDIASLDSETLPEVFADIPSTTHPRAQLAGEGADMIEILKATNLATSNREAREFLANGSVSINGEKITPETRLTESHLLHNQFIAIRRGKKNWHMTRWE